MTSIGRQPQNIKSGIFQQPIIGSNLSLDEQTTFYKSLKWRHPPMEEDLNILKVEYLSIHHLDYTHILNLS